MADQGPFIDPGDPRYPALVRGFNLRWVGSPRYVRVCTSTDDVVAAVREARDAGARVTVRGGGHCYEDFVTENDGGVILDLAPMNTVEHDPGTGLYSVGGGATLWNVYGELFKRWGVTLPGGSCYSVGAGGHVVGGGYGLLSRLHGLTVDYLEAVEVVRVDGSGNVEVVMARRDGESEDERRMLWAHQGGGGGNFGIVTRYFFRDLPPAPSQATLLNLAWNWSDLDEESFASLMTAYGAFLAENSAPGSPYAGLFTLLHVNQNLPASPQIVLVAQYVGDDASLLDELEGRLSAGLPGPVPPTSPTGWQHTLRPTTSAQRLPWLQATQTLNGSGHNMRGKYKSAYMIEPFPERQIATIWEWLSPPAEGPSAQALLQVDSYGCQVNAVAPDATAVAQRSSIMKLQYQAYWSDASQDDENLAWIRGFYDAMYGPDGPVPDGTMDGCFVNYCDVDLVDWQRLYYKENYPALQRAKALWDPTDAFTHAQSIELPGRA
ncbi:MAG TPA: FAD-binding oxidoreductase [Solirubrobacteraceae bacterium]|jgi:FAD/FMN-containing dehydrogenase